MNWWKGIAWSEGMRIGWFIFWRGLAMSFVVGFVIGFFGGLFSLPQYFYLGFAAVFAPIVVWPTVVSQLLRKKFRGFHLAIIRDSSAN